MESTEEIVNKNSKNFDGPLFIFGMARSGTTYLRRLINTLPDVFLMYESTTINLAYDLFYSEEILSDRASFQRFINKLADSERNIFGKLSPLFTQSIDFYDRLYNHFCEHRNFAEFCKELFINTVPEDGIWGNKLVNRDELTMLLKTFKNAKFIIIVRDIRAVVSSNEEFFGVNNYISALTWKDTARILRKIIDDEQSNRLMILHYEDLVEDYKKTLTNIATYIGSSLPEDLPEELRAHAKSIDKWRDKLPVNKTRVVEELCYDEMIYFGYNPEYAKGPKNINKIKFYVSLIFHIKSRLSKNSFKLKDLFNYKSLVRYLKLYNKTPSDS